jgi:hypothetical protein
MKTTLIILMLMCLVLPLGAQQFGQVGTSGAQLLKINMDPRASGLGYAATTVAEGASAVYTNVAGLEKVTTGDVSFAYTPWFAGINIGSVAAAWRIPEVGVIGIQATGFSTTEEITTIDQENGTGQTYSIRDVVVGLSFARALTDRLALGFQAKYISESYYAHTASGIAFDIGSQYNLGFSGARIALTLQNFGPNFGALSGTYGDYSDNNIQKSYNAVPLPVTFRASFSMEPLVGESYRLRVIGDLVHPNDNIEHYNLGGELWLMDAIAIRGGALINYDNESFALGIGLRGDEILGQRVRIDYSFEKFSVLPNVHKIAVGFAL